MQACDRCHARKTRCDRRIPRCGACEKAGAACLHVDKLRSRNLPRGYVESVEEDLRKTQDENLELQRQINALRGQLFGTRNSPPGSSTGNENNAADPMETETETETETEARHDREQTVANQTTPTTGPSHSFSDGSTKDAVTVEVGYLTLTAAGETRFIGSSSGLALADILGSVLNSQHLASSWAGPNHDRLTQQLNIAPIDEPISPRAVADEFINAYFQHTHITFPLLHRPSFLAAVEQIYDNPEYYSKHTFDAFVFDMVLSIGSSNPNRFGESTARSAAYYARAQMKIKEVLNMGGLVPLQAILLLCQHGIFSNGRDTSASIWHLIGMGARICVELGLHLEPKRTTHRSAAAPGPNPPTAFETEMRKRVFWCFYNLDRSVSVTLGRPVAIRDEDINVSLPSCLPDEDFGPDRPFEPPPPSGVGEASILSPFLHLTRIRHLSGKILSTIYTAKPTNDVSLETKIKVRQELYEEIMEWKKSTGLLQLDDGPHDGQSFVSCFRSAEWYEAVANNAVLLLYRPSPYLPYPALATTTTMDGQQQQEGDLYRMFLAAKTSINSYYELHRKRRLNYSWMTLHGVFIAALAYVYAIGRALKDPTQGMPIPDMIDIITDTRACSNIFVVICEKYDVARSPIELFHRLSTAVIKDAIGAATTTSASTTTTTTTTTRDSRQTHPHRTTHDNNNTLQSNGAGAGLEGVLPQPPPFPQPRNYPLNTTQENVNDGVVPSQQAANRGGEHFDSMFSEFRNSASSTSAGLDSFWGDPTLSNGMMAPGFSQDWAFDEAQFLSQDGYDMFLSRWSESW